MTDIEKYAAIMREIKRRAEVIGLFQSRQKEAHYLQTTVETVGLQFRKIFELIAFASLAANRAQYSAAHVDFATHWRAKRLLKNLQRINPHFYPQPFVETPTHERGALHDFKDRNQDYLTPNDLIVAHDHCGALMHAANPFGSEIDYAFYERSFPIWMTKITNLLNKHLVQLLGDTGFYVFHMQEEGHGDVGWCRFKPMNR
jgi:hypothetical protein